MTATTPIVVGLIGGIASGKSTVARMLQARGALWLDSDSMAHAVLNSPEVLELISGRFGREVVQSDGRADRQKLASLVFGSGQQLAENLAWLQSIIHPRVRLLTEKRIQTEGPGHPLVLIDAPLLLEAGWGPRCQRILFIDTPLERRQQWAVERGWPAEEIKRREAAQMSLEDKRQQATDVINNDGSIADLELQVDRFIEGLSRS